MAASILTVIVVVDVVVLILMKVVVLVVRNENEIDVIVTDSLSVIMYTIMRTFPG